MRPEGSPYSEQTGPKDLVLMSCLERQRQESLGGHSLLFLPWHLRERGPWSVALRSRTVKAGTAGLEGIKGRTLSVN